MTGNTTYDKVHFAVMAIEAAVEKALDLYYSTRTAEKLADAGTGLQLMSDKYVLEDILNELRMPKS